MPPRVTLKDISQKTGYAVITVSKALRDSAAGTRERIAQAAREMGYVRNASALSLRSGVSRTLALIVSDIANPLFGVVARQAEMLARQRGYVMLLMNTDEQLAQEVEAVDTAISLNVGGVLIFPCQQSDEPIRRLRERGVPFVVLGRRVDDESADSVLLNDKQGGYLATRHLLDQGYRRILMLNAEPRISSARDRYDGYLAAHRDAGISPVQSLHVVCGSMADSCAQLVQAKRADAYDAIFAFNDLLAFQAMQTLRELGLRVPQDVGVAGFDDIASDTAYASSLTSVAIPKAELARRAVELLLARIEGNGGDAPQCDLLDVRLVVRDSTRKAPRGGAEAR